MWNVYGTRVCVCLQNFYVLVTSSLALSNLLHFPDPLRPYCVEEATATEAVSSSSLTTIKIFLKIDDESKVPRVYPSGEIETDTACRKKKRKYVIKKYRALASQNRMVSCLGETWTESPRRVYKISHKQDRYLDATRPTSCASCTLGWRVDASLPRYTLQRV